MAGPRRNYTKPWLAIADQIPILQGRGLTVADTSAAEKFLRHANYYRFSGYCLAFETARHVFAAGTTFEDIQAAYHFDAELRDLFTESLEVIEVDLRTAVAHHFGKAYGPFGHALTTSFHPRFDFQTTHAKWLSRLVEETQRSNELFVKHFKSSYLEHPNLPVWAVTEVMSFGSLSRMIGAMHKADRRSVSDQYGLAPVVLSSLTHQLAYVRNLCAHHSRLWDRDWSIKCDVPNDANWRGPNAVDNSRVLFTLLMMKQVMKRSPYLQEFCDAWSTRLRALIQTKLPKANASLAAMGMSATWFNHPMWA